MIETISVGFVAILSYLLGFSRNVNFYLASVQGMTLVCYKQIVHVLFCKEMLAIDLLRSKARCDTME